MKNTIFSSVPSETQQLLNAASDFFNFSHESIYTTDLDGIILAVNKRLTDLTGYTNAELIGKHTRILKSGIHDLSFYKSLWKTVKTTGSWTGELTNRKKDGSLYNIITTIITIFDDNNNPIRYLSVGTDISSIIETRELCKTYANFDMLTGLPNKRHLDTLLKSAKSSAIRNNNIAAILFLDLDGFKQINGNYGHAIGDLFLCEISKKLQNLLRDSDSLVRLGGDEFVIILTNLHSTDDIVVPLTNILQTCREPITVENIMLNTSVSIGISFYKPTYDVDCETILRNADQSMYIAKMKGKNQYHIYDQTVDKLVSTRTEILNDTLSSLNQNHFVLHYQPKVNIKTGELLGVEALIRWNHPTQGLLYPESFLPHILNTTIGIIIDDLVIVSAMKQYNKWLEIGFDIPISINLDSKYISQYNFNEKIDLFFKKYNIPKNKISIELLESSCINLNNEFIKKINKCIESGILFEMDDFGVGYSSISNLLNIPISTLKIDRYFVNKIQNNDHHYITIEHIINLSNKLNIKCIAEGVETVEQGEILLSLGCKYAQGYLIAKPMSELDIPQWIRT